jgi:hypothetical protein
MVRQVLLELRCHKLQTTAAILACPAWQLMAYASMIKAHTMHMCASSMTAQTKKPHPKAVLFTDAPTQQPRNAGCPRPIATNSPMTRELAAVAQTAHHMWSDLPILSPRFRASVAAYAAASCCCSIKVCAAVCALLLRDAVKQICLHHL